MALPGCSQRVSVRLIRSNFLDIVVTLLLVLVLVLVNPSSYLKCTLLRDSELLTTTKEKICVTGECVL